MATELRPERRATDSHPPVTIVNPGDTVCPDPSAHSWKSQRQQQASKAARNVTNPTRTACGMAMSPLGPDRKLSSAGAATSIKYARAQHIPGQTAAASDAIACAGAAANIANNMKVETKSRKREPSDAAERAALLAKDYRMTPLWQPEASTAGSRAALLAHRDGGKLTHRVPSAPQEVSSAAGIAMRSTIPNSEVSDRHTDEGRKGALSAATGALSRRKRSGSTPPTVPSYSDAGNLTRIALNAATLAHHPSPRVPGGTGYSCSDALDPAGVHNVRVNMPREMFSERPPITSEVEDEKRQNALHASAISMAKKMYEVQQAIEGTTTATSVDAATTEHSQQPIASREQEIRDQAMKYISLQEAARKLAAERLAKLKPPDEMVQLRSYYGYDDEKPKRLSMRRKTGRRRASSEGAGPADYDDQERSRRIRSQMMIFNNQLAEIDSWKRQRDREALLAAAERRVHAQMHDMDERVFQETGKVPPAMMEEWEAKARARAMADSQARMANYGKVHIGGGKFLDQSEIDAIAASRIRPTLEHATGEAEKQRARDEERKLDEEEKKRQTHIQRERETELKAELKRARKEEKDALKRRKAGKKEAMRTYDVTEKASGQEETSQKEEKQRSVEATMASAKEANLLTARSDQDHATGNASSTEAPATVAAREDSRPNLVQQITQVETSESSDEAEHGESDEVEDHHAQPQTRPASGATRVSDVTVSATREPRGFKSFLIKLRRRSRRSGLAGEHGELADRGTDEVDPRQQEHFANTSVADFDSIAAMARTDYASTSPSRPFGLTSEDQPERRRSLSISPIPSAMLDVERGRSGRPASVDDKVRAKNANSSTTDVSEDEFEEARDTFDEHLAPPVLFATDGRRGESSPGRGSRFSEEF